MKSIVYLHGFISSPQSRKAVMLGDYLKNQAPDIRYIVPELHHQPSKAIVQVMRACEGLAPEDFAIFGSSLGGFYATVVAEQLGCKAALLNPAVHPHRRFHDFVGTQTNMYTGESFELTQRHVDELREMDVPAISRPQRYWLIVETGDEVLDYREAVAAYPGAFHTVIQGGDHALSSFHEHVPDLVQWVRE